MADEVMVDRTQYSASAQAQYFTAEADVALDAMDHDELHAAATILLLPADLQSDLMTETEYISRWLDGLWRKFVVGL